MRLISNRQLTGDYGSVAAGEQFECSEDVGAHLLRQGSARRADPPRILYDTKIVVPEAPTVGARLPFRNCPLHNPESAPVAPEGDSVLPAADVPEGTQGTTDPVRRRGRPRLNPR